MNNEIKQLKNKIDQLKKDGINKGFYKHLDFFNKGIYEILKENNQLDKVIK